MSKSWDSMTAFERAQSAEEVALMLSHHAEAELRRVIISQVRWKERIETFAVEARAQRALADAEMSGNRP